MRRTLLTAALLAVLIIGSMTGSMAVLAHAQTFEFHQPSFGLYCENEGVIQEGEVSFALSDFQPEKLEASSRSRYQIKTEVGQTEKFAIPFIARPYEVPAFEVSAGGKAVEGQVLYGDSYFDFSSFDVGEAMRSMPSTELEGQEGIYYSATATATTVVVTIERSSRQKLIQDFRASRSTHEATGRDTFTIENAQLGSSYSFFIIGEEAAVAVEGAELEKESRSAKAYVDGIYTELQEYYDDFGGVPVEFFYAQLNKVASSSSMDNLFFDSVSGYRLMAYEFSVVAEAESFEIEYEQKGLRVLNNSRFSPAVYMLEQRAAGGYTASYSFALSESFPFLLESSTEAHKGADGGYSITEQGTDFYLVFSSTAKPKDLLAPEGSKPDTVKIVLWCVFGVAVAGLCVCIGFIIRGRVKASKK